MFTTFMIPLFIFTTVKKTFSKISSSFSSKILLYPCYLYIINHYLNKLKKKFFFLCFRIILFQIQTFYKFFSNFFFYFFQNFFLKIKNYVWNYFFLKNYIFFKYLFIYLLDIPKTIPHLSTLKRKCKLVNPRGISIFYPSLKMRVKVISVNMKNGAMNVVFVAIFL